MSNIYVFVKNNGGLDIETILVKKKFKNGVSLVQIATETEVYLIDFADDTTTSNIASFDDHTAARTEDHKILRDEGDMNHIIEGEKQKLILNENKTDNTDNNTGYNKRRSSVKKMKIRNAVFDRRNFDNVQNFSPSRRSFTEEEINKEHRQNMNIVDLDNKKIDNTIDKKIDNHVVNNKNIDDNNIDNNIIADKNSDSLNINSYTHEQVNNNESPNCLREVIIII